MTGVWCYCLCVKQQVCLSSCHGYAVAQPVAGEGVGSKQGLAVPQTSVST